MTQEVTIATAGVIIKREETPNAREISLRHNTDKEYGRVKQLHMSEDNKLSYFQRNILFSAFAVFCAVVICTVLATNSANNESSKLIEDFKKTAKEKKFDNLDCLEAAREQSAKCDNVVSMLYNAAIILLLIIIIAAILIYHEETHKSPKARQEMFMLIAEILEKKTSHIKELMALQLRDELNVKLLEKDLAVKEEQLQKISDDNQEMRKKFMNDKTELNEKLRNLKNKVRETEEEVERVQSDAAKEAAAKEAAAGKKKEESSCVIS